MTNHLASVSIWVRALCLPVILMLAVLSSTSASAAPPHCTAQGATFDEQFGYSIASVGDVNGDGFGDLAVGAPFYSGVCQNCGRVYIVSGENCSFIRIHDVSTPVRFFGSTIRRLNDITADGVAEYMVVSYATSVAGGYGFNQLKIFSGQNGSLVFAKNLDTSASDLTPNFPESIVEDMGDVDNDGTPDFGTSSSFSAKIYSGISGNVIDEMYRSVDLPLSPFIRGIQDYDNDGKRDYVFKGTLGTTAGNPVGTFGIASSKPNVNEVAAPYGHICPPDLTPQGCAAPPLVPDGNGQSLYRTIRDVNHDGFDEFALLTQIAPVYQNRLVIRSGRYPFQVLYAIPSLNVGDFFGFSTTTGEDFDHDGVPDVIADGSSTQDYLRVFSGVDGSELFRYFSDVGSEALGFGGVAQMPDVTGDGVGEIAAGSPRYGFTQLPTGYAYRGRVVIVKGPREGGELGGDEYFNIGGTVVVL